MISTHYLEMLVRDLALPSFGVVVLSELILREPTRGGIVSSEVAPESVNTFSRRHLPRFWDWKLLLWKLATISPPKPILHVSP